MPIYAYILVETTKGKAWDVADAISKMRDVFGVKNVHPVAGSFDVACYAELPDLEALKRFVNTIHGIEWVLRTQTLIAM